MFSPFAAERVEKYVVKGGFSADGSVMIVQQLGRNVVAETKARPDKPSIQIDRMALMLAEQKNRTHKIKMVNTHQLKVKTRNTRNKISRRRLSALDLVDRLLLLNLSKRVSAKK